MSDLAAVIAELAVRIFLFDLAVFPAAGLGISSLIFCFNLSLLYHLCDLLIDFKNTVIVVLVL